MPKKVLPTAEAFQKFFGELEMRGFRRTTQGELASDFRRLALKAPSPREDREIGYTFSANGLTVVVWTTLLEEGCMRDSDSGWVLIKMGDTVLYYSHPIHRTKDFLRNLLGHARIARLRVLHRPLCPTCGKRMFIAFGKALKTRYWRCNRHPEPQHLSWDHGLSTRALKFLSDARRERERYRKRARAEGKEPGAALRRRRGWKVGRPENLEPA